MFRDTEAMRDLITETLQGIMQDEQEATEHRLRAAELLGLAWDVLDSEGVYD